METTTTPPVQMPELFEYDDYRKYLCDWYAASKLRLRAFSFRYFSRQAGFQSPNFLKLVMEGKRNLSAESIDRFVRVLKLDRSRTTYFRNLVLMNQATGFEEKSFYAEQLLGMRPKGPRKILAQAQYAYLSNWYNVPIREMVALKDFREDPEWIAERIIAPIKASEIKKSLEDLQTLGLLRRNEDGRLVQADGQVGFGDELLRGPTLRYHRSMLERAVESIDRPNAEREISGITLPLTRANAVKMRALIQKFRKELFDLAADEKEADVVYQTNFQFFPLTKEQKTAKEYSA